MTASVMPIVKDLPVEEGHHLTTTQIYLNMSPEDVLREYEDKW